MSMEPMNKRDELSLQGPNSKVKLVVSLLLMALFLVGGYFVAVKLIQSRKKPQRSKPPVARLSVEAVRVRTGEYTISVISHGTVIPGVEGTLIPEVPGRIVGISPSLIDGGSFNKDEVLLQIEELDYRLAIPKAESQLAGVRLALAEEEARSDQALRDWQRFHKGEAGGDLTLRKPQLAKAQADLAAAEAALEQAKLNLQRTAIIAPYNGKVLSKEVSVGQYVGPGTVLARIYGVDYFEVKLPLNSDQLQYLTIPEVKATPSSTAKGMKVTLVADIGKQQLQYPGTIVRSQGVIDAKSRQLFVIARVDDPLRINGTGVSLEPGRFVEARLTGETLQDVFVIPRSAVKEGRRILVVDGENKLYQRLVEVLHADRDKAVIREGLSPGELVCVSPVVFDGKPIEVQVRVLGEEPGAGSKVPKPKGPDMKKGETSGARSVQ